MNLIRIQLQHMIVIHGVRTVLNHIADITQNLSEQTLPIFNKQEDKEPLTKEELKSIANNLSKDMF